MHKLQNKAALAEEESTDLDDSLEAVDVDFNTVKNLLESYNQQMGLPGPTSNLLESMGVKLPHNTDDQYCKQLYVLSQFISQQR